MNNVAIVAIPAQDDFVYKISSEKVPHMTLLFLGETDKVKNLNLIFDFVKFAADQSLRRFGLEVESRGTLGPDQADVVVFSKHKWSGFENVKAFRSYLLKNDNIRKAYDATEQFPDWIPHLTLGHPDAPAKPDERDFPGIHHVNFDRIAVWFGEFEGIEFPLRAHDWDHEWDMNLAWSSGSEDVLDLLSHHGVKGQKWGVRRSMPSGPQGVTVGSKGIGGRKIKTKGGGGHPAHPDAIRARTSGQIAKKSGVKALSDKELQDYTKRLQLEASVQRLNHNEKPAVKRAVASILGQSGKNTAQNVANDVAAGQVKKHLGRKLVALGATAAVG